MDKTAQLGIAGVSAFALVYGLTPLVRRIALQAGWVARPMTDRWGRRVVARLGGIALFAGFLTASLVWIPLRQPLLGLLLGCVLVFVLGLFDDLRRMAPYTKLLFQLGVGALVVMGGVRIELIGWSLVSIPLSIAWFVLVMNAFNLLDNMDGLAAGVGAIAAGFCALHAASAGQWVIATMATIMSGACLGFLPYNVPPAKIFMGDSGSHLMGLSLAALALLGSWDHSTQLLSILAVPMLVLAVPIFDTCFVAIQRVMHRQHPFQGGTDHVSHRLAILGLSERQTVLSLYVVSAGFGLLSLLSRRLGLLSTVVLWCLTFTGVILAGAFLAKVKVYELKRQPVTATAPPSPRPMTFVDTMLLHKRRLLEILVDFGLICSAYVAAHLLRFEATLTPDLQRLIVQSLPVIIVIKLACFTSLGLYRGVWRYVSLPDLLTVFKAVTLSSVFSALALLYLWRFEGYSRAVFIIDWLLLFLGVSATRVVERLLNEWILSVAKDATPTLIVGAGDTGELALRHLKQNGQGKRRVVGFLDDDVKKYGNHIHGLPVLGTRAALPRILSTFQVREVLIAISRPPSQLIADVQRVCEQAHVPCKVLSTIMLES